MFGEMDVSEFEGEVGLKGLQSVEELVDCFELSLDDVSARFEVGVEGIRHDDGGAGIV